MSGPPVSVPPSSGAPAQRASAPAAAAEEVFRPLSARTAALAAVGLVTAIPPWWLTTTPASGVGHALLGVGILVYASWGVWRPLVVVGPEALRYRPRLAGRAGFGLRLSQVEAVLPVPRTGHAPSERDLEAWLGLRLAGGAVRWLDLTELPAAARRRVRALVASRCGRREAPQG